MMGIRKSMVGGAEFHVIHRFDLNVSSGNCSVDVASYASEMDAFYSRERLALATFICDFIEQSETINNQIYANLLLQEPFIGGEVFGLVDLSGQIPRIKPVPPSVNHVWDAASESWVITPQQIESYRLAARARINAGWKLAEASGFAAYGKVFDSDARAVQRILGAAQAAALAKGAGQTLTIDWTCKDNSTLTMDTDMLIQVPIFIAQAGALLHARSQALKALIAAAATIEEIDAVQW